MITIDLGRLEYFDSDSNQFEYEEGGKVRFEYSLRVMYEWESKWRKPFLKDQRTSEEMLDFYRMMAIDPMDDRFFTDEIITKLSNYIEHPDTATTFSNHGESSGPSRSNKVYTAEELYALMFSAGIPLEFEDRNLNRLLVILRIISAQQTKPKPMSKQDIYKQNASLNAQRKAQMKTKG